MACFDKIFGRDNSFDFDEWIKNDVLEKWYDDSIKGIYAFLYPCAITSHGLYGGSTPYYTIEQVIYIPKNELTINEEKGYISYQWGMYEKNYYMFKDINSSWVFADKDFVYNDEIIKRGE